MQRDGTVSVTLLCLCTSPRYRVKFTGVFLFQPLASIKAVLCSGRQYTNKLCINYVVAHVVNGVVELCYVVFDVVNDVLELCYVLIDVVNDVVEFCEVIIDVVIGVVKLCCDVVCYDWCCGAM